MALLSNQMVFMHFLMCLFWDLSWPLNVLILQTFFFMDKYVLMEHVLMCLFFYLLLKIETFEKNTVKQ